MTGRPPDLSLVVCAYDMTRELPRTLRSLHPPYQSGVDAAALEILVVDNGSPQPVCVDPDAVPCARVLRFPPGDASPVRAINAAAAEARADKIGVFIDGARMASPGLLDTARNALDLSMESVAGTLSYHLGHEPQPISVAKGYDAAAEDALLEEARWWEDGYRLFDVSCLAVSSAKGFSRLPSETNALFVSRSRWREVGGFDERFRCPGGGLANLDLWKRLCESAAGPVMMIAGEGTFHQVHGGVATNSPKSKWDQFEREYRDIRGEAFRAPASPYVLVGSPQSPRLANAV